MTKDELIRFMHSCGFDWICDVTLVNSIELVASKYNDCDKFWWRPVEVEGSGFTQLFKGSIKKAITNSVDFGSKSIESKLHYETIYNN